MLNHIDQTFASYASITNYLNRSNTTHIKPLYASLTSYASIAIINIVEHINFYKDSEKV